MSSPAAASDDEKYTANDNAADDNDDNSSPERPTKTAVDPEEDDDDEEEEDEDEEEDDDDEGQGRNRVKKRKINRNRNRFIEDEAEVDDEDEDLDEEDEDYVRETEEFIDQDAALEAEGGVDARRVERDHQRIERRRREYDDRDAERIAAEFRERHKHQQARAFVGDEDNLPQSMLVPSVEDPKLWQVRAKPGREKQLVYSLTVKSLDLQYSEKPLSIYSAFQRDSLPGFIYVEAKNRSAVETACQGLVGVYMSRGVNLVPIDEMTALLKLTKKRVELTEGSWVRIKRGRYQGDLAQVLDVTENGEEVGLKFVPRIDMSKEDSTDPSKKRKKTMTGTLTNRPPQKMFQFDEVSKVYGSRAIIRRGDSSIFAGDTYVDGFLEKDLKMTAIETDNVNPTMDEIEAFMGGKERAEDYTRIQELAKQAAMSALQPGDVVEVTQDQNKGAIGTVVTIAEGIVTLKRTSGENVGAELTVRGEFVKKTFRAGEHVKAMAGTYLDETGMVLKVEGDLVTFMSDLSKQEITVFSKDLRVASEVGSGLNAIGQHELHDLIPLEGNNYGIIYRTERDMFEVLDLQGKSVRVKPHLVSTKISSMGSTSAYDLNGQPIRKGESVVEAAGDKRSGVVIAIRGLFVFLYNRDIAVNEGVFVVSPRTLISAASKTARVETDLTKLNPELGKLAPAGSGVALQTRRFRDPLTDLAVVIVRGINKSRVGIIKDVNGEICRVELQSSNQTVTVNKSALLRKDPRTGATGPLPSGPAPMAAGVPYKRPGSEIAMGPPGTVNPYGGLAGATPNPYAGDGGRTPAYFAGRTPNPYAAGGATPSGAWGFGAATPAPNAGGRTPAYGMVQGGGRTPAVAGLQGGRTPAPVAGGRTPYAGGVGGRTPAYAGAGGRTPAYGALGGRTPAYGGGYHHDGPSHTTNWSGATPHGAGSSAYDSERSEPTPAWQAPTDGWGSAPTPGAGLHSAPTPGVYGAAPTPGPTPGAGPYSAPTPYASAPTPGAGGYSAPTPAADW